MTPRVIKRPKAKLDLLEQATYIADDNPDAAQRFLDAAQAEFGRLAANPGMGRQWELRSPRLQELRSWAIPRFRNYLIFYRPHPQGIEVIRVLHAARDLAAILEHEA